jgi:CRISPR-associated protein Csb1
MSKLIERLVRAVGHDAAIRRVRRLQPTGGRGDKLFPPTYPVDDKPQHAFEHRYVGDGGAANVRKMCVLIDSVQSQANRLEEALSTARDAGDVGFPAITVDFSKTEVADIGQLSTLQVPHRIFDAIVRDSELQGERFLRESKEGKALLFAKPQNARAIFEMSPTALVFGAWNSTGEGGGLGAKFPRTVVSEIVGIDVVTEPVPSKDGRESRSAEERASGVRTGSRIDPLGIRASVKVWKSKTDWTFDAPKGGTDQEAKVGKQKGAKETNEAKGSAKEVKPSEINHSNIAPTVQQLGVTVDHVLHTFVLSCSALRRLGFTGGKSKEGDDAARATLAALGLLSAVAQDRTGYYLRSRCDLVPEAGQTSDFEIVRADGTSEPFALDYEEACALVKAAHERASSHGVRWLDEDIVLTPQAKLVELVKRSREKALEGEPDPDAKG